MSIYDGIKDTERPLRTGDKVKIKTPTGNGRRGIVVYVVREKTKTQVINTCFVRLTGDQETTPFIQEELELEFDITEQGVAYVS